MPLSSVAVAFCQVTTASHWPAFAVNEVAGGHWIVGGLSPNKYQQ